MNSLTVGFIYTLGVGWVFCEALAAASYGSGAPLFLVSLAVIAFFSLLGCLPASDEKVSTIGAVFAMVLGLFMTYFAFTALLSIEHMIYGPSMLVAIIKIVAALFFLGAGILAVISRKDEQAH